MIYKSMDVRKGSATHKYILKIAENLKDDSFAFEIPILDHKVYVYRFVDKGIHGMIGFRIHGEDVKECCLFAQKELTRDEIETYLKRISPS